MENISLGAPFSIGGALLTLEAPFSIGGAANATKSDSAIVAIRNVLSGLTVECG